VTVERDHHGFDAPAPLGHPGRSGLPNGHPTGPEVGDRLPDFELPDAHGHLVDYHKSRGQAKSVVVFYRSAVW
jgi:hypothetical protein